MAQIYGELIRAQLQSATNLTIGADATGLIYFHTGDKKLTVYDGTDWQKLVTEVALTSSLSGKVDANAAITGATKTKITFDSKGLVTSGADLEIGDIPTITAEKGGLGQDASAFTGVLKASAGTFSAAELVDADVSATAAIAQSKIENLTTDLGNKVEANAAITGATKTKITYDAKGLVTAGADIESNDLPSELFLKTISSTTTMGGALTLPAGDESEKIGLLTQGMIRYNTELATFEGCDGAEWGAIGGGGSAGGTVVTVPQVAHGLSVGDAVYLNGSVYTKAIATSAAAAEVVGVVSKADLLDEFDLTLSGELTGLTGLTNGEVYFLSAATPGLLTITEPTVIGQVSVPVGVASSATTMYVAPKRGSIVGGVNARAEVALTSGAVTNVQSVAGMTAGELAGWVFISSSPARRFYVSAKFALSGAGGDYNLSYQTTGDTPPAGFLVDITTTGMIRVTLPASSGSTSVINYALNAPAIGASFPLTVDAGTILSGTVDDERLPDPTTYTDAKATKLGLKQYLHGTSYNGGIAPTVSGATVSSVNKGVFVPYQMQDGSWRLRFNINIVSTSTNDVQPSINGITTINQFQSISSMTNNGQAILASLALSNSSIFRCLYASPSSSITLFSGDVELASKPTWAY
jgi:hypothetical protein